MPDVLVAITPHAPKSSTAPPFLPTLRPDRIIGHHHTRSGTAEKSMLKNP
jgi:hypothetical protein